VSSTTGFDFAISSLLPEYQVTTSGSFGSTWKYYGGALASNGKIYCAPFTNATAVGVIDPATDTMDVTSLTWPALAGDTNTWQGAVAGRNGKVYMIPNRSQTVLVVNTVTNSVTRIGSLSTAQNKWCGGVLAPNGNIYGVPHSSTDILVIDTSNDTVTTLPPSTFTSDVQTLLAGNFKFRGGVLGADGCVYMVPSSSTSVLRLDPSTNTAQLITVTNWVNNGWQCGVLAPNGNIYCMPHDSSQVLVVNTLPHTSTGPYGSTSTIPTALTTQSARFGGGTLAPNGKIYAMPMSAGACLVIDPVANTATATTLGATWSGTTLTVGSVLAPNGKIYGVPGNSTVLPALRIKGLASAGTWMLAPEFNKF
jgi:hypothetical protein